MQIDGNLYGSIYVLEIHCHTQQYPTMNMAKVLQMILLMVDRCEWMSSTTCLSTLVVEGWWVGSCRVIRVVSSAIGDR